MCFSQYSQGPYWCWNGLLFDRWSETYSTRLPSSFNTLLVVSDSFLAFYYDSMFQAHLGHVLPQTWDQVFLQGNLVPFSEKWCLRTAVWAVGVLTHYSWVCCRFSAFSVGATRARKSLFHGYETHKYVVCEYYLK